MVIKGRVCRMDASVEQPDDDSLPVASFAPEPSAVPEPEERRGVRGHELQLSIWERT
jgi:hypothetical protein